MNLTHCLLIFLLLVQYFSKNMFETVFEIYSCLPNMTSERFE